MAPSPLARRALLALLTASVLSSARAEVRDRATPRSRTLGARPATTLPAPLPERDPSTPIAGRGLAGPVSHGECTDLETWIEAGARDWLASGMTQWPWSAGPVQTAPPVGSSRVDLQACKLEYSIVSPK